MCGRRKLEQARSELCHWGDMEYDLVRFIAYQTPRNIVVQMHNNGEPLLYPLLGPVLNQFRNNIRCFNTNGKLLLERADDIIGNMETLTVSVIQDDPEGDEQYGVVTEFLRKRNTQKPHLIYRLLGNVHNKQRWLELPGVVATRILHAPEASRDYSKPTTVPEIGICLDLLTHMAIDRFGNISMCVRLDPEGHLRIGHVNDGLRTAWNSKKRRTYIEYHINQKRSELPGCRDCHFWGVPRGE